MPIIDDMLIINDPDGRALRNLKKAGDMSRAIFEQVSLEANKVFQSNHPPLEVGELICTVALGNNCKQYKIFQINEATVTISLPDMVMETVEISSLYYPYMAIKLYLELEEGA